MEETKLSMGCHCRQSYVTLWILVFFYSALYYDCENPKNPQFVTLTVFVVCNPDWILSLSPCPHYAHFGVIDYIKDCLHYLFFGMGDWVGGFVPYLLAYVKGVLVLIPILAKVK